MYVKLRLQQKGTFFFSFLLSKFLEYQFMKIIPVLIIFFFSPGATTPIGGCILQPSSGL